MKTKTILACAFITSISIVVSCASVNPVPIDPSQGGSDGGTGDASALALDGKASFTCASACANLRAHECALGNKTIRGATCEQVCGNVQDSNAGAGFNVACMSKATSCALAEACR